MNQYIYKLINLLYSKDMQLYENTRHFYTYEQQLNRTFNKENNIDDMQEAYWLEESYHVSNVFDKVIDVIEKLYFDNKDNVGLKNDFIEIYTGYNFDNNTSICNKLDNEKIKYPIYLRIAYDEKNQTYAAVWSRQKAKDKIVIELNAGRIKDNMELLRSSCKHEFLHIRESYAKEYIDVLQSNKNRLPDNDKESDNCPFIYLIGSIHLDKALSCCYLFNKAELRARLNAVYEYVKNENVSIDSLNEITSLSEMKKIIVFMKMIRSHYNYYALELFNYYLVKYNIIKTKFNNYHFEYYMRYSEYTKDEKDKLDAMIFELQEQYMKFKRDIQKVIYNKFHN